MLPDPSKYRVPAPENGLVPETPANNWPRSVVVSVPVVVVVDPVPVPVPVPVVVVVPLSKDPGNPLPTDEYE
jgi:hypothetical protein